MIILILIFLGLAFGSFVNAFVYRLFEADKHTYGIGLKKAKRSTFNLSVVNGRSICVHCKHELSYLDLIPVLSWFFLRGKCRYCKKPISWQYPAVEVTTAFLFVSSYVFWPYSVNSLYGWIIFGFWLIYLIGFMSLLVFDIKWMLLPNKIVYSLLGIYVVQLGIMLIFGNIGISGLISILLGAISISGFFWAIFQISGGNWIGGGDVKLALLLGALAGGVVEAVLVLFIASVLGSIIGGGALLLEKRFNMKTQLPFGPYLMTATIIVVLFGSSLVDWYKNLIYL
ncbi:prepilin peptidase [Candidatus Saccharibacteria bacterium]|nr:prepilin peptidase [Candidatus Saccharibacteria bacterium]